jgi:hypothetical protein
MQLGSRILSKGDNRRMIIDYRDWLAEGRTLSAATVTAIGATSTVTVAVPTFDDAQRRLYLHVQAGQISEKFTATVQVTSTDGQIVTDTIAFTVT